MKKTLYFLITFFVLLLVFTIWQKQEKHNISNYKKTTVKDLGTMEPLKEKITTEDLYKVEPLKEIKEIDKVKYLEKITMKDLRQIEIPKQINKIDKIKYLEKKEILLIVVEEVDEKRALWSYNNENQFKRLIKLDYKLYDGFIHLDSKDNIYFETNEPHYFYKSDDFGKNWQLISHGDKHMFWSITDAGNSILYASAWSTNSPIIYKSENQGNNWVIWKDFHKIFQEEAVKYNIDDARYKLRHLHDIVFYKNNIIVGTGDVARWTLISEDNGNTWQKIWDEGFTSHILIPDNNIILLSSDINSESGIVSYNFDTKETKNLWNPEQDGWAGYIYSMLKKNNNYYAAVHNEVDNNLKYGILSSKDGFIWESYLELDLINKENTRLYIADGQENKVYLNINNKLYYFIQG